MEYLKIQTYNYLQIHKEKCAQGYSTELFFEIHATIVNFEIFVLYLETRDVWLNARAFEKCTPLHPVQFLPRHDPKLPNHEYHGKLQF